MKYQVVSDGSMDLSPELAKEKNIEVVPFYVSFDSENYKKEIVEMLLIYFFLIKELIRSSKLSL